MTPSPHACQEAPYDNRNSALKTFLRALEAPACCAPPLESIFIPKQKRRAFDMALMTSSLRRLVFFRQVPADLTAPLRPRRDFFIERPCDRERLAFRTDLTRHVRFPASRDTSVSRSSNSQSSPWPAVRPMLQVRADCKSVHRIPAMMVGA